MLLPTSFWRGHAARIRVLYREGDVLEFSLVTGEAINRIKTGGHPFYATQLADKHTLAIFSVLDNRMFIVDMNTHPAW